MFYFLCNKYNMNLCTYLCKYYFLICTSTMIIVYQCKFEFFTMLLHDFRLWITTASNLTKEKYKHDSVESNSFVAVFFSKWNLAAFQGRCHQAKLIEWNILQNVWRSIKDDICKFFMIWVLLCMDQMEAVQCDFVVQLTPRRIFSSWA